MHCLAAQGCSKQESRADVVGLLNPKAWPEAQQVGTVYSARVLIDIPTGSASCIYTSHKVNCTQNRTTLPVLLNRALAVLLMCKGGATHLAIGNHSIAISVNKGKKIMRCMKCSLRFPTSKRTGVTQGLSKHSKPNHCIDTMQKQHENASWRGSMSTTSINPTQFEMAALVRPQVEIFARSLQFGGSK